MGTKHDPLTDEEMASYSVPPCVFASIEQFCTIRGLDRSQLRILDWGCGRGRTVGKLLQAGYNAWGIDVDANPLEKGRGWFARHGFGAEERLLCFRPGEQLPFPEGFFHIVVSDQVLEHVEDMETCVCEMNRVTALGGLGIHTFPAKLCVVEPHLFMPFVHWIPKGVLRDLAIAGFVGLGLEQKPYWPDNQGDRRSRTRGYAEYSRERTFYRWNSKLRRVFERYGFAVTIAPSAAMSPFLPGTQPSLNVLGWKRFARSLLHWYQTTCKHVTLFTKKT